MNHDESDASKAKRWRRPPKPNKTDATEPTSRRTPAPVRYGRCEGDLPALRPCIRWVRANVAARPDPDAAEGTRPTWSQPASRAAVPTPTKPDGDVLSAADVLGEGASAAASAADVEDDVMLVGEGDDVEYIPVESGNARVSRASQEPEAGQGPAVQPMVAAGPTQSNLGSTRHGSGVRYAVVVAALACVAVWLAREPVRLALRETPPSKQPAAQGNRNARRMRFDVPEMVITLPQEAPAAAKSTVQPAVRRPVAGGKDAAALAELERIAAGLGGK